MSGMENLGNNMIHSPGQSLNTNQLSQLSTMNNLIKDPSMDPAAVTGLQEQRKELLSNDTGGYLGALGRMATGSGMNKTENIGGAALQGIMGLLQRQNAINAAHQVNNNMNSTMQNTLQAQKQALTNGNF